MSDIYEEPIEALIGRSSLGARRVRVLAEHAPPDISWPRLSSGWRRCRQERRATRLNRGHIAVAKTFPDPRGAVMTDRRAGPRQGPYVGKQPCARTQNGTWRRKRRDAGVNRKRR